MATGELLVPDFEKDPGNVGLFERVLAKLPLADAVRERNPLTGRLEFVAPPGTAFRISGEFMLDTDQNDIVIWGPPQESRAMIAKRVAEMSDFEREHPFRRDDDPEAAPNDFIGTRLSVSINRRFLGDAVPGREQWQPKPRSNSSDSDRPEVIVHIFGQTEAWYETGLTNHNWRVTDGAAWEIDLFDIPNALDYWRTVKGKGDFLAATVELVPYEASQPQVKVVEVSEDDKKLWHPDPYGTTVDETIAYYADKDDFRRLYHRVPTVDALEEERTAFMRQRRREGRPFLDDPLRHCKILEGDVYQPSVLDLDEVAARAEESCNEPPKSYSSALRQQDRAFAHRHREKRIKQLQETLAVIVGNVSLHELVRENSSDVWIEREMAPYECHYSRYDEPF